MTLIILDIGANFPDSVFRGIYHGKKCHADDFIPMLKRCSQVGLTGIMSTSTSMEDYVENSEIISEFREIEGLPKILTTLGVHPSYCSNVFEGQKCQKDWPKVDEYFEEMRQIFASSSAHLVAIGECGLDYARLFRSSKELQIEFFRRHFSLLRGLEASKRPPMFLHLRDCFADFMSILEENRDIFPGGVVHSFTGTVEEARKLLEFSDRLFIGMNGCSLREEEGIRVAETLPIDRIMIESDAPYCEMRPSHASKAYLEGFSWPIPKSLDKEKHSCENPVRGRNEPTETRRVLRVLSKIKGVDEEELASQIYANTLKLFPQCH